MSTEVYRYQGDQTIYKVIEPGEYRTIINVNSDGDEEIIVVKCRQDDKCSAIYTIHPRAILPEATPPEALYDKYDVENRALVIMPGREEIINTRERVGGSNQLVSIRYRFSHRLNK